MADDGLGVVPTVVVAADTVVVLAVAFHRVAEVEGVGGEPHTHIPRVADVSVVGTMDDYRRLVHPWLGVPPLAVGRTRRSGRQAVACTGTAVAVDSVDGHEHYGCRPVGRQLYLIPYTSESHGDLGFGPRWYPPRGRGHRTASSIGSISLLDTTDGTHPCRVAHSDHGQTYGT